MDFNNPARRGSANKEQGEKSSSLITILISSTILYYFANIDYL